MGKIDNSLVFLSSENARIKLKDLSRILKKSQQRLKYSIMMLEKEGIIGNPHCVFDYSYFGLILFRIYFKGGYIGERDKASIVRKLSGNAYIVSVYELNGEFDLAVEVLAPNPSKFNKEFKRLISTMPTLNNYKVLLNLVTHLYPRSYLAKDDILMNAVQQEIIVGGDRKIEQFNDNEKIIMKCLLENPRTRYTALAKKADMNVKTAMTALKNLQNRKVVRGFKHTIDTNKLDITKARLFINLHNLSQERENELMQFLMHAREIVQVNKTLGDWDMEIDVESFDKARLRYFTVQLRENFKDLIENFNMIEFYHCYMRSYLPMYLFKEETNQH